LAFLTVHNEPQLTTIVNGACDLAVREPRDPLPRVPQGDSSNRFCSGTPHLRKCSIPAHRVVGLGLSV
jgi:hypothetical protein